jgi:lysozyme family protein
MRIVEGMRENFNKAFDLLMELEGYESNDAPDKGGYTKYGISQKYHPNVNVPKLTKDEAKEIYLEQYWIPAGCDTIVDKIDILVFVQAVNLGVNKINAIRSKCNGMLDFYMLNLEHYCTREKIQREVFLTGWCNRLIKLWRAL